MIPWLSARTPFPPLARALAEPNGLLAAGGDLSPERLVAAYRRGIFPWYSEGQPILWWSPDPRMVLPVAGFRVSRSLRKRVAARTFETRVDTAFRDVVGACAAVPRPGQRGTWITAEMVDAYCELHRLGYAHSVESWRDGRLVGGLYGLALGAAFFGESMFHLERDASKVALVHLVARLRAGGFRLLDTQFVTPHLASLGAIPVPRTAYRRMLDAAVDAEADFHAWPADAKISGARALAALRSAR